MSKNNALPCNKSLKSYSEPFPLHVHAEALGRPAKKGVVEAFL